MQPNQNPNYQPLPPSPEQGANGAVEQYPAANESAPVAPQGTSQPVSIPEIPNVPAQQLPVDPAPATDQHAASAPLPNPVTADDVDVIEKEWVDQADKVIAETKDDPYVQEEAVESLQQDYLLKRYGHDVKKPDGN